MGSIESSVRRIGCAVTIAALLLCPEISRADESGISFWLPGQFGSLAATPVAPGWSLGSVYYHTSVEASGNAAAATRMGSISDSLTSVGDLYPMMTLKWNVGVNNYMTYVTGDIPVGAYDPTRLAKCD
jgi:hypothetical protein